MSKKPYSPPVLKNLTPEQAKKIIVDGRNCSEEEAARFLESLRHQLLGQEQNGPVIETKAPGSAWERSGNHTRRKSC